MSKAYRPLVQIAAAIVLFAATLASPATEYFQKNDFFSTPQELESFAKDSSDFGNLIDQPGVLRAAITDSSDHREVWKVEFNCACQTDESAAIFYDYDQKKIVGGYGRMFGVRCGSETEKPAMSQSQEARAKVLSEYFIKKVVWTKMNSECYPLALQSYKEKSMRSSAGFASDAVNWKFWKYFPISAVNVDKYNDIGFFLEQGARYAEAVLVLEKVIEAVPTRTAAYLNIGDAYWGLKQDDEACLYYGTYASMMRKEGKEKKIPSRIAERCAVK